MASRSHRRSAASGDRWEAWPEDDLRILKVAADCTQDYRLVYSFAADAVTTVSLQEAASLLQRGVLEIDELPGGPIPEDL